MAKKFAKGRVIIHLECVCCRESRRGVVSPVTPPQKQAHYTASTEFMKYCRYSRKHELHREIK